MAEPTRKKAPLWLKVLIIIVLLVILLGFAASIGMTVLSGIFSSKGEKIVGKGLEKWIEHSIKKEGADVDLDISGKTIVIKDKKSGQQLTLKADNKLPEGFPKEIPIPSNSKITGSMTLGPMKTVTIETGHSLKKIIEHYKDHMSKNGWKSLMQMVNENKNFSGVFSKGKHHLTVGISSKNDDNTVVSLSYTKKP